MPGKESFSKRAAELHRVASHLNPTRRGQRTKREDLDPLETELITYMGIRRSSAYLFIASFETTLSHRIALSEMENVNRYGFTEARAGVQAKIDETISLNEEQRKIGLFSALALSERKTDVRRNDIQEWFDTIRSVGTELATAFYSGKNAPSLRKLQEEAQRIKLAEAKIPPRILDNMDEAFSQQQVEPNNS